MSWNCPKITVAFSEHFVFIHPETATFLQLIGLNQITWPSGTKWGVALPMLNLYNILTIATTQNAK